MYLRNGRAVVFDLGTRKSVEQEMPEVHDWGSLSAIRMADSLIAEHGSDCLVLGTGALTGSFVPASCCGIIRSRRERPKAVPLLGFAGVELKMSGFDFVVIKGGAETAGYLWLRDGIVELSESEEMRAMNSWARTDKVRADQGDSKIQVITTGLWGDAGHESSQLVTDYWGGEDKVGMAADLARKGILAVAFRGMGELELAEPEGHFEEALLLMREQIDMLGESRGLASYFEAASREDFSRLVHRHVACYGCPFPCRTFLKTAEDPRELRLVSKEPGYLHYDIAALERAFGLGADAKVASEIIAECAKAGAEPVAVVSEMERSGRSPTFDECLSVIRTAGAAAPAKAENFERAFKKVEDYETCLGLGLCPRYWSKVGFDLQTIAPFAESAFGWPGQ